MKFRKKEDLVFKFGNLLVEVLGDPHLGKRFQAGVPISRRGEREEMVWADFTSSVVDTTANIHVCMGDLFDNFSVDDTTLIRAALTYKEAGHRNPNTHYFVLMGNHDMARDAEKASSFRVFKEIVSTLDNIHVVDQAMDWFYPATAQVFAFFPYHPFRTSEEVMTEFLASRQWKKFDAIFGHWDLDSFGEMPHNMFPAELAQTITDQAFTGHIHLPDIRDYNNLELVVVGSMQPYSHSEDPEHQLYVTLTLEDLRVIDPTLLKQKCVRIVLNQGEDAPEGLDALQYITKRMDAPDDDEDLEVVLEDFDFRHIITQELVKQGVTDEGVVLSVMTEFDRLRAEEMV